MQIYLLYGIVFCYLTIWIRPVSTSGWARVMPLIPIDGPSWFVPSNKDPKNVVIIGEVIEPPSVTVMKPGADINVPSTTLPIGKSETSVASSAQPVSIAVQPTVAPVPGPIAVQPTVVPTVTPVQLPITVSASLPPVSELTNLPMGQISAQPTLAPIPGPTAVQTTMPPVPGPIAVQPTVFPAPGWVGVITTLNPSPLPSTVPATLPQIQELVTQPTVASSVEAVTLQPTGSPAVVTTGQTVIKHVVIKHIVHKTTGTPSEILSTVPAVQPTAATQPELTAAPVGPINIQETVTNATVPVATEPQNSTAVPTLGPFPTLGSGQTTGLVTDKTTPVPVIITAQPTVGTTVVPVVGTSIAFQIDTAQTAIELEIPTMGPVAGETTPGANQTAWVTLGQVVVQTTAGAAGPVTVQPTSVPIQLPSNWTTISFLTDTDQTANELEIPTIAPIAAGNETTPGLGTSQTVLATTGHVSQTDGATGPVTGQPNVVPTQQTLNGTTGSFVVDTAQTAIDLEIPTMGPTAGNETTPAQGTSHTVLPTTGQIIETTGAAGPVTVQSTISPTLLPLPGTTISFNIDTAGTVHTVEPAGPIDLLIPSIEPLVTGTTLNIGTTGVMFQTISNVKQSSTVETTVMLVATNVPTVIPTSVVPIVQSAVPEQSTVGQNTPAPTVQPAAVPNPTTALPSNAVALETGPTILPVVQGTTPPSTIIQNVSTTVAFVQPSAATGATSIPGPVPVIPKKVEGVIPDRPGFTHAQTSGRTSPCLINKDCFNLREPNEWCPMPTISSFMDRGCFCDKSSNVCVIERTVNNVKEWTYCTPKAESRCIPVL